MASRPRKDDNDDQEGEDNNIDDDDDDATATISAAAAADRATTARAAISHLRLRGVISTARWSFLALGPPDDNALFIGSMMVSSIYFGLSNFREANAAAWVDGCSSMMLYVVAGQPQETEIQNVANGVS